MEIRPRYIYARSKLADAFEALVIGEGDVRSQLLRALMATTAVTPADLKRPRHRLAARMRFGDLDIRSALKC
jgi:hypothetical protein